MITLPRLIIAAPMSGSGKTTIVAGLIAALAARGLRVAPFKVGPDYIDPTYHTLAAGRVCHNLDSWMLPAEQVTALLAHHTRDADLALIEGVMGLFDGVAGRDDTGSTAHIARITGAPVLLVLDVRAMARTAAALVCGLRDFEPQVRVAGVILNRVGSERHAAMVREAIEEHAGLPVVGFLTRDEALHLPERHLGLIPTSEPGRWQAWLDQARERVEATIDLDQVLDLARSALLLQNATTQGDKAPSPQASLAVSPHSFRASAPPPVVAVARDAAFSFLYADNLDLLRAAGAAIVFFSPLEDQALPPGAGAIYLCGGFPELYAADLAANEAMRAAIRSAVAGGMSVYAECGGLMYLTEEIVDHQGVTHPMVGLLPGRSVMTGQLTMGYRIVRAHADSWLWHAGETVRGHEFHYSTWEQPGDLPAAYEVLPGHRQAEARSDGVMTQGVFATYIHLHFRAYPELAARLVAAAGRL